MPSAGWSAGPTCAATLAAVANANRPPECPSVDQNRNNRLGHADPDQHDPVEIKSGELFRVEVDGELRLTRMEEVWGEGYYSIDLYPLRDGMRGAIGADD
jgi:hypothetical protein